MTNFKIDTLYRTDPRIQNFLEVYESGLSSSYDTWFMDDYDKFFENEIVVFFINNQVERLIPLIQRTAPFIPDHFRFAQLPMNPKLEAAELQFILEYFSVYHPDAFLEYEGHIEENNKWGYRKILNTDTLGAYSFHNLSPYAKKEKQKEILWAFHSYYSRKEIENIQIKVKRKEELKREINGINDHFERIPIIQNTTGMYTYYGFTYFTPNEFWNEWDESNEYYIVAYASEHDKQKQYNKIVGMISLSYKHSIHRLSFIDVHFQYRRMGIATRLYQALNQCLKPTDILISTELSEEGQAAHLDKLRKSILLNCSQQYQTLSEYHQSNHQIA